MSAHRRPATDRQVAIRIAVGMVVLVTLTATLAAALGRDVPKAQAAPEPSPAVETRTVVVTEVSKECQRFARNADAFVKVTSDYMAVMNTAIEAQGDGDMDVLGDALVELEGVVERLDAVSDRYSDTRAGCL